MTAEMRSVEQSIREGALGAFDLSGKVAVVTGGSSGIGAAIARALSRAGASVVVGYHRGAERASEIVAGLGGDNHRAMQIPLGDAGALAAVAAVVSDIYGRCDVLVNSAGTTKRVAHNDLETMTPELFESLMSLNVAGPYAVIRAFVPLLKATGDAAIINVSSVSGLTASGSNIAYCASKAALDNLTMSLGRALGPEVRVLGVAPAAVDTDFVGGRGRDQIVAQAATTPLRVVVHPDDVATCVIGAVTHLRIATGTTLLVDGGKHL
ncbi:SDR family oxidoreductase [Nocardioides sp. NPDC127503]|uniref:SDR family NAD(P)-dependent oxidoreductase n=1 Tax=Nocardioides sp. NPDC127503 TaxID=3154516 RepID=UPI00331C8B35